MSRSKERLWEYQRRVLELEIRMRAMEIQRSVELSSLNENHDKQIERMRRSVVALQHAASSGEKLMADWGNFLRGANNWYRRAAAWHRKVTGVSHAKPSRGRRRC